MIITDLKGKRRAKELKKIPEGWKYSVTKSTVDLGLEHYRTDTPYRYKT